MPKKATTKKTPAKKPVPKKGSTAKKPAAKKASAAKKPVSKKSTTKKTTTTKKSAPKKGSTAKKPAAKKSTAKKSTSKKPASKKTPKKGETYIAKAPIRRLMKDKGANLVAAGAVDLLIDFLEKEAINTTKKALKIINGQKRKRIMAADIHKAGMKISA